MKAHSFKHNGHLISLYIRKGDWYVTIEYPGKLTREFTFDGRYTMAEVRVFAEIRCN